MRRLAALVFTLALVAGAAEDPAAIVARLQPAQGWTAPEPARVAQRDNLFDLIDGGAELYQEYGFVRAVSWQLENTARSSIQIELYEMADAPAAYGVWSLMQTGEFARGTLGQGSLRFGYYVAFWSGPYFATVTGAQTDTATQAEVDRLAASLAALLPRDGVLPGWFAETPAGGREVRKYFRGKIGFSNLTATDAADWFEIGEGLVVDGPGRQDLILNFDSPATARRAAQSALASARKQPGVADLVVSEGGFSARSPKGDRVDVRCSGNRVSIIRP